MSGDLAGLTLDAVLGTSRGYEKPVRYEKPSPPPRLPPSPPPRMVGGFANKTLLDIIRDEEPGSLFGQKDKKSWKAFRDRLRLKRAGAAWTSTIHTPTSDIPIQNSNNTFNNMNTGGGPRSNRSLMSRRTSVRYTTVSSIESTDDSNDDGNDNDFDNENYDRPISGAGKPLMVRRISSRYGVTPSKDENIHAVDEITSRRKNHRLPYLDDAEDDAMVRDGVGRNTRRVGTGLIEDRTMSARDAVVAQEAAEAAAAARAVEEWNSPAESDEDTEEEQPVKMSLMDLLEETDREMGFEGSLYTMGGEEEEECEYDDEDDEGDGIEHTCCVCMVRHKGAAFIPCGHTFCRLCSRELWAQRGNCPLCNGFIAEILDIF